ncbi:MAG: hypothetical protein DMF76_21350 [Acidobacteria bacterium]|nr:MAG: hypothetical protein DMF76_21350 [Acidobacteriota bacterium]
MYRQNALAVTVKLLVKSRLERTVLGQSPSRFRYNTKTSRYKSYCTVAFIPTADRSAQRSESHPLKTHRTVHPRTPIETVD